MKYEVIIFDADETLFDFKKSERSAIEKAMREFGVDYDEGYHLPIYKEINDRMWEELELGLITQKKLKTERFKKLSEKLGIGFCQHEFAKVYTKHLSQASFLYEGSIERIRDLKQDFRLTIMTNGLTDVQNGRIRKSEIAKYFEDIVISEEVGASKPDPKIFEIALENIGVKDKSKVLMVGDSLTSDIQGGINFGIDTCWFNAKKVSNDKGIKPTYEIDDLSQIREIAGLK